MKLSRLFRRSLSILMVLVILAACAPAQRSGVNMAAVPGQATPTSSTPAPTALPTRPPFEPGELVDYTVQTGDTLPALAAHFNTTEREIRANNPILPRDVTTLPPGMPMKIPIYYQPLWGSSFQIVPDVVFVNGPADRGFDTTTFINESGGWLKSVSEFAADKQRSGAQIVDYVAWTYSLSPRLLLALIEYQAGGLSQPAPANPIYPLGYEDQFHNGLYMQLVWAANTLNNGYYGWRSGQLREFEHPDTRLERPDPWQNAASVALQFYFSRTLDAQAYLEATHGNGLRATFTALFGDPWEYATAQPPLIPGSLQQPLMLLPFARGSAWTYTGGPHTGWGQGAPFAAVDFAPPALTRGCVETSEFATAVADGIIVHTEPAMAVLDLDGDNDERTGWVVFYLHVASADQVKTGAVVKAGDPIGRPSCEGGNATGSHVHIARKYNGEWVSADGPLAFNLEGWIAHSGTDAYLGTFTRYGEVITACTCSNRESQILAGQ